MKVPYSWLKEFVDIDLSVEELSAKLVGCGFEIEEVINLRDSIKNVVVGKILTKEKHPNSDHLNVCQVNVGKETLQIITGADNINVGDLVPIALDGAVLPDGKTIKNGELRGLPSNGMMCSGEELDLTEEDYKGASVYGILILNDDAKIGEDVNDVIGNDEVVLDVAVTANRPDCNSILGIAREVAAVTGKTLKMPDFDYVANNEDVSDYVEVDNKNYDLCPRYTACAVKDVKQMPSPKIIRDRLKAVGIRAINNLVDVTNYVLVEIGQPMHAFDLNNLEGKKIVVRNAEEGESIVALDGKKYELKKEQLMICDDVKPIAVAGIMGGEYSSICDTTSTVILEAAKFVRDSIRHTSRNLNLKSDSSARFEKGIDFISQDYGMKRALALFYKYKWGTVVGGKIDKCKLSYGDRTITYSYHEINKIIGKEVAKQDIMRILNSLTLTTTDDGDVLTTVVPNYREDIVGINDLTEEVIRMYGYDIIEGRMLSNTQGGRNEYQIKMDKVKDVMVGKGAFEIVGYSFITPKAYDLLRLDADDPARKCIALANPLSVDFSVMRTLLSYTMLKTLSSNVARGNDSIRLFEVAKTYIPKTLPLTDLPEEKNKLCVGVIGEDEDFYTVKGMVNDLLDVFGLQAKYVRAKVNFLHPGRSAEIMVGDTNIGFIGEVEPDVADEFNLDKHSYLAEIDIEYVVNNGKILKPYKNISKFQAMQRDLALIAPMSMPADIILDTIKKSVSGIFEDAKVFDVYTGGQVLTGRKSVAIKLTFRDMDKTLRDDDVNAEIDNILAELSKIDVKLR